MIGLNKSILIISPEPWKWQHVSKHHYAITLSKKGYGVYFLNPPQEELKNIIILKTEYKNLHQIEAPQAFKGLRFLPKILRVYITSKWLKNLEKVINSRIDTIWLFESSRFYDMEFAKDRLKIYHQVDTNQDFHIKEAASSADICFCVTDYIKRDLLPYNKNIFKISHGINLENKQGSLLKKQLENFNPNKLNIAYIGNLDAYDIDINILYTIIKENPNVLFHFIGTYSKEKNTYKTCEKFNNIIWWGRVESDLIMPILAKVDITLLTYLVAEQSANSHKLLEYFYSGKVTVATYTDEYKDKRYLLEMVDSSTEFIEKFKMVVQNIAIYNSDEKQKERIMFAKDNTYKKQLSKILHLLEENNLKL